MLMSIPIIAVTGTKGKTTTVAVIADVLRKLDHNVLKVDTTGHFVNGERKSTLDDAKAIWRLVPTVAPGRYLWEFYIHPELRENGVAVLETALGASGAPGVGYRYHNVGVFLNVFEDHIGSSDRIQSKADIVKAKDFVFRLLDPRSGYAVFNADDEFVLTALPSIPSELRKPSAMIACGLTFDKFDVTTHLSEGGIVVTVDEAKQLVVRQLQGEVVVADLTVIPWTFGGTFSPSVWNLMSAVGALYGYFGGALPAGFRQALESVRLDPYGGRLTLLESDKGVKILADYAHEKVSLASVADLGRTMLDGTGKLIGVVRLAHDRTDDLMRETGKIVGEAYDQLVVYEKIDGYLRKPQPTSTRFPQITGRTSEIFAGAIAEVNQNTERILREDEALARAAEVAKPGDVVVVIVNDDIERSIRFIKEKFHANFI